ncbi:unnamed protein product [Kluyveromyces dobzhanskii CBS 2104]|uniref:WGS project CCBQ000000000 data, contig 00102 n=1 Tax=Kluyveromyces dobzhanskii CBS 2104 TaxID=1427455 RepID=A0A0A8L6P2_9SACH|nr:unnamed protein product [Kluyveromyces dobzhanskii CBS 2104]
MLKWIQGGISAVTGIAEPEYGQECIHTCTDRVKGKQPFHATSTKDFQWESPDYTNVETSTFYFTDLDKGYTGFAQVIHSNIIGLHTTAQFTFRVYHKENPADQIWTSVKLENFRLEGTNFFADNLSIIMNEEGTEVEFKSTVDKHVEVDFTIHRAVPGVKVGEDPTTYYGDDITQPWGSMKHVFWPRNHISGKITAKNEEENVNIDLEFSKDQKQYSMFVKAIQGMKPHHAAKSWTFLNFQSEKYSAVLMEFTTPRSYANTKVNVGIVCDTENILSVTVDNNAEYLKPEVDSVGWPVPKEIAVSFKGVSADVPDDAVEAAEPFNALVSGHLDNLVERVDVMAEIPTFVKNIVSGVAGTKPYIYQFFDDFKMNFNDEQIEGFGWCEITFISETTEAEQEQEQEQGENESSAYEENLF